MKFNLGDYDLGDLGRGDFNLGDFDLIPCTRTAKRRYKVKHYYTVSTLNEAHQMLNEQPIEID